MLVGDESISSEAMGPNDAPSLSAFFMLSGGAFHRYENGVNDYIDLRNIFRWQGTVILMRIPVVLPEGFNYIDYLE